MTYSWNPKFVINSQKHSTGSSGTSVNNISVLAKYVVDRLAILINMIKWHLLTSLLLEGVKSGNFSCCNLIISTLCLKVLTYKWVIVYLKEINGFICYAIFFLFHKLYSKYKQQIHILVSKAYTWMAVKIRLDQVFIFPQRRY